MGADPDPRYGISGKLHIVLRQQYKGYSNDDPPPERVKPVPLQLLRFVVDSLQSTELCKAVADLLIIGYFFLLRPGEYCFQKDDNNPFRLQDVSFDVASTTLNATAIPLDDLPSTLLVHLRFTTQKNGVRDEDITHGSTDDPLLCPLKAVARRIRHLREHNAAADTPLHIVYRRGGTPQAVPSSALTARLREGVTKLGATLNFTTQEVSARALRAGGCMALFRANISRTNMQLMGRWRSWAMLEYLHRAGTDTSSFAKQMLDCGAFRLHRHTPLPLPQDVIPIVQPFLALNTAADVSST